MERLSNGDLSNFWAEGPTTPMQIAIAGVLAPGSLVGADHSFRSVSRGSGGSSATGGPEIVGVGSGAGSDPREHPVSPGAPRPAAPRPAAVSNTDRLVRARTGTG